ncbi:MAG: hypothetical protein K6B41_12365 [Butyrivibrio sp.]|nr:hypothetical protein [Butyrivibrio sp.]
MTALDTDVIIQIKEIEVAYLKSMLFDVSGTDDKSRKVNTPKCLIS